MGEDLSFKEKYMQRIQRSISFIDKNLDKSLNIEEIAAAGNFSKFHFHRIFTKYMGEPVMKYVSRRRIERAATQLIYARHKSITSISSTTGFSGPANFSKQFKSHYGITPRQGRKLRKTPVDSGDFINIDALPDVTQKSIRDNNTTLGTIRLVHRKETPVVGYMLTEGYEKEHVFFAREKITQWKNEQPKVDTGREYDIFLDSHSTTEEKKQRYIRAIEVDKKLQVQAPYFTFEIPGGLFAEIHSSVHLSECRAMIEAFLKKWLPENGFEIGYPPMCDYASDDSNGDWFFLIKKTTG